MKNLALLSLASLTLIAASGARAEERTGDYSWVESVTFEGGPIWSKHFQSGDENFREDHGLAVVKVETEDYGNWGVYLLTPNSVDDTSVGFGYVTDPYTIPVGGMKLELTGALGLVTGYQDFPVPLVAGQGRLVMIERETWDAGVAMAVMPYYMEDDVTGDNEWGVVGTTPFLSLRYRFD